MPIISQIGRRSAKTRMLVYSIYAVLGLGAVTMIYPLMLMLSGTSKSDVDTPDAVMIPKFLRSDDELYKKELEGFFNESLELMKSSFDMDTPSFRNAAPPRDVNRRLVTEWEAFLHDKSLPSYYSELSYMNVPCTRGTIPLHLREFKSTLVDKFGGDLDRMNKDMGTRFQDWNSMKIAPEIHLLRAIAVSASPIPMIKAYREFKEARPSKEKFHLSSAGFYKHSFLKALYEDIDQYNLAHKTSHKSWNEIRLSRELPQAAAAKEREDWINFVREYLNPVWIRPAPEARPVYAAYLAAKHGDIGELNRRYQTSYTSFDEVPLFDGRITTETALVDHSAFVKGWRDVKTDKTHQLPESMTRVTSVDFEFSDYLKGKYKSIDDAKNACGISPVSWDAIAAPQREAHYLAFLERTGPTKVEFLTRNYIAVIDYICLHGNALFNTFVYCALSVLASLTINPIAAYALSRYRPPSTYKILLFMMLTMAFPPLVTQIPVFLLLKKLSLLNTYWALLLPGLANGYSIFLLKGFFDSLPKELYESAQIDGANELTVFWQISMRLSTPILAVIALGAFIGAYSNFMMALLVCQDQKMWTIMPWLYQLQTTSAQGVVFAALVLVAIPTMLVYSLCQNVIMRGIVVPVEK